MKKILAAMMVMVILTASLVMAQAEVRMTGYSHMGTLNVDGMYTPESWYIEFTSDHDGMPFNVEVTQEEYDDFVLEYETERQAAKEEHENKWYVKTGNWFVGAWDFVTFWD